MNNPVLNRIYHAIHRHESDLFRDSFRTGQWVKKTYSLHLLRGGTEKQHIKVSKKNSAVVTIKPYKDEDSLLVVGKEMTPKGGHKQIFSKKYPCQSMSESPRNFDDADVEIIIQKILDFFSSCSTQEIIRSRVFPKPHTFVENGLSVQLRTGWKRGRERWVYRTNMINTCRLKGVGYLRKDGKVMMDGAPTDKEVWFIIEAETDCSGPFVFVYDGHLTYHMIKSSTMKITESPLPQAGWTGYMKTKDRRDLRLSKNDKALLDQMIEHTLKKASS